ncbi:MAG: response regulator transcription factor [Spirochaetota bacterium]
MVDDTKSILILEDDDDLRSGLTFALSQEGYEVSSVDTIAGADHAVAVHAFDLLILDVMLPDGSGFDFCRRVRNGEQLDVEGQARRTSDDVPVIFLTARDDEVDVVQGLEIGGDDYIAKPFRLRELLSRVKARLRREAGPAGPDRGSTGTPDVEGAPAAATPVGRVRIDTRRAVVTRDDRPVPLTATEYRLLLALFEHAGQVLSRDQLADRLMGTDAAAVDDNTVAVYVRRLREKLEDDPSNPRLIRTVRGLGYRLEEQP